MKNECLLEFFFNLFKSEENCYLYINKKMYLHYEMAPRTDGRFLRNCAEKTRVGVYYRW